jgi:hypothetical protein
MPIQIDQEEIRYFCMPSDDEMMIMCYLESYVLKETHKMFLIEPLMIYFNVI